jgi:CBS domain-containing protein
MVSSRPPPTAAISGEPAAAAKVSREVSRAATLYFTSIVYVRLPTFRLKMLRGTIATGRGSPGRRTTMKVAECMTRDVRTVTPEQPLREAARMMLEADTGVLPVTDADRVIGMITDRDIAVRAVAIDRGPETPVREAMSGEVLQAFEDEDVDDVALRMSDRQVRRMPVMSRDDRLVGMISVGDLAKSDDSSTAEAALSGIVQPGGQHDQSSARADGSQA